MRLTVGLALAAVLITPAVASEKHPWVQRVVFTDSPSDVYAQNINKQIQEMVRELEAEQCGRDQEQRGCKP